VGEREGGGETETGGGGGGVTEQAGMYQTGRQERKERIRQERAKK
jgi:hypothetical protein